MAGNINVALVYKDLRLGGVQKKIVEIAHALDSHSEVKTYIVLTDSQGEYLQKIPKRAHVIDLHVSLHSPQVFSLPLKLAREYRRHKPTIVLAMMDTFGCSAVVARKMSGNVKPKVLISQNSHMTSFFHERPFSQFRSALVKILYPQADAILSISDAVSRDLRNNYMIPGKKVIEIKNWVKIAETDMPRVKKTIDIVYVGRFAPEKDIPLLLEAFALLRKRRPNSVMHLVGYGKMELMIRQKIEDLNMNNSVILPGFTHDVRGVLQRARVFVMTSHNEGIPRAMLEAMFMGVPVISRSFPGVDEIIRHKETGFIADSADSFSWWMDYLLSHQKAARRVAEAARGFVKKYHSEKNLEKLVSILLSYS